MLYAIKNKIYLKVGNYFKEVIVDKKDDEFFVNTISESQKIENNSNIQAIPLTIEEAFSYRSPKNPKGYSRRKMDELEEFEERMV